MYDSPNHGGARPETRGVVIHSTRSDVERSPSEEYASTIAWFNDPNSQVSAHAVVGPRGLADYPVAANLIAWHARDYNETHLGIEMVQPCHGDPIGDDVIDKAAQIVAGWCLLYKIPLQWDLQNGLCEHREIPPGVREGKTDVDLPFNRDDFLARVKRYAGVSEEQEMTDDQRKAVTDHLAVIDGYRSQVKQVADVAKSAVLDEAQDAIYQRLLAIKQTLNLI